MTKLITILMCLTLIAGNFNFPVTAQNTNISNKIDKIKQPKSELNSLKEYCPKVITIKQIKRAYWCNPKDKYGSFDKDMAQILSTKTGKEVINNINKIPSKSPIIFYRGEDIVRWEDEDLRVQLSNIKELFVVESMCNLMSTSSIILLHELVHVQQFLSISGVDSERLSKIDLGQYSNPYENIAIKYENQFRKEINIPRRLFHDGNSVTKNCTQKDIAKLETRNKTKYKVADLLAKDTDKITLNNHSVNYSTKTLSAKKRPKKTTNTKTTIPTTKKSNSETKNKKD